MLFHDAAVLKSTLEVGIGMVTSRTLKPMTGKKNSMKLFHLNCHIDCHNVTWAFTVHVTAIEQKV